MFSSAHARRRRRARGRFGNAGGQRRLNAGLVLGVLALVVSTISQCTGGTLTLNRVDLKVLVLTANPTDPAIADNPLNPANERALVRELQSEGIPTRVVDLNDANRPTIDAAFLATAAGTNPVVNRSFYQGIVLPNSQVDANFKGAKPLTAAEYQAISDWEVKFGIREVVASTYGHAEVGLANPVWQGNPAGLTATVTPAGLAGPFKNLKGTFTMDANSYASTAAPASADFTPLVNLPTGPVVGSYSTGGRERLAITTNYLYSQSHFQALAHGIITWVTKGVHLGYDRSYLTVHSDDTFAEDSRWSITGNCTPGEDCPANITTPNIRMKAEDVTYQVQWQNTWGLPIVQVFNGFYANNEDFIDPVTGRDALTDAFVANRNSIQWINHTFDHSFLGCDQDTTVVPWKCKTNASGVIYKDQAFIYNQINDNKVKAAALGLPIDPTELVTGEHSGLYILPQQPVDNPFLAPALTQAGIKTTAADASRQNDPRTIGSARTVPRHPINIFFNTATKAEAVDEYNWIFTSQAAGGSGICTANGFECVTPVTNFDTQIVPANTLQAMQYIQANDPRPTYMHVANQTEDRLMYTQLESILTTYRNTYAASAPLVSQTQTAASQTLDAQYAWNTALANNQVEAYTIGNQVYISTTGGYTGKVPVTAPAGTKTGTLAIGPAFGESYAGEQSAWISVAATPNQTYLLLPSA